MTTVTDTDQSKVLKLAVGREIIEQRARTAQNCECLAMWDDDRQCICDKQVEIPLSVADLKRAKDIVSEIELNDRRMATLKELPGDYVRCKAHRDAEIIYRHSHNGRGPVSWSDGHAEEYLTEVSIRLPKKIALAALREERAQLLAQLQETGIVSVDAANIRTLLK